MFSGAWFLVHAHLSSTNLRSSELWTLYMVFCMPRNRYILPKWQLYDKIRFKTIGCWSCPIICSQTHKIYRREWGDVRISIQLMWVTQCKKPTTWRSLRPIKLMVLGIYGFWHWIYHIKPTIFQDMTATFMVLLGSLEVRRKSKGCRRRVTCSDICVYSYVCM